MMKRGYLISETIILICLGLLIGIVIGILTSASLNSSLHGEAIYNYLGVGIRALPNSQVHYIATNCLTEYYTIGGKTIELYCFNAMYQLGKMVKEDHSNQIHEVLNIINNVGTVDNPFEGAVPAINALENMDVIVDASVPSLINPINPGRVQCGGIMGSANYQDAARSQFDKNTINLCNSFWAQDRSGVRNAGILYHEANHFYRGSHEYDCDSDEQFSEDWDFNSVYGAHINFLLALSQNSYFTCDDRFEAYTIAQFENENKLCSRPVFPPAGYPKPEC